LPPLSTALMSFIESNETRPVWKTRPIALGLTLLAGSLLLVAVGLTVDGTFLGIWLADRFDFKPFVISAWHYLRWAMAVFFAVLAVELLYHFGPDCFPTLRPKAQVAAPGSSEVLQAGIHSVAAHVRDTAGKRAEWQAPNDSGLLAGGRTKLRS
jgi:uncharacterized BrkB/YihY/UPF0761 family membrane protein